QQHQDATHHQQLDERKTPAVASHLATYQATAALLSTLSFQRRQRLLLQALVGERHQGEHVLDVGAVVVEEEGAGLAAAAAVLAPEADGVPAGEPGQRGRAEQAELFLDRLEAAAVAEAAQGVAEVDVQ